MGTPGYLRLLYQIYSKLFAHYDNLYVCILTNRGLCLQHFGVFFLIYEFKIYKIKWYFFVLILYKYYEKILLCGW